MSELWALLHFIMPNLFDSHEQFQEWFSKDIEAHSQEKGELNKEQLNRLHKILKPFMLRRVKKDVENEIGPKVEYEILCDMTERQKILYNSIKEKLSNISDLFTSVDSKVKVENLMNLVMQFRKVCNHPEIFERNLGKVPFIFRDLNFYRTSTIINGPNLIAELRIDRGNCIECYIPKLVYDEAYGGLDRHLRKYSIFNYENILEGVNKNNFSGLFNFVSLFQFSAKEFLNLVKMDSLISTICLSHYLQVISNKNNYKKNRKIFYSNEDNDNYSINSLVNSSSNFFKRVNIFVNPTLYALNEENCLFYLRAQADKDIIEPLIYDSILDIKERIYKPLTRHRFYIPRAIAMPIKVSSSSSRVRNEMTNTFNNLIANKLFYVIT
jgi:DNA helicase INO80